GGEGRAPLEPAGRVGGRGRREVVDRHGAVAAGVLGRTEVRPHLLERRRAGPEGKRGDAEPVSHLRPCSFLASSFVSPPTRGCGRPPSVTAIASTISSARGASWSRTSIAS